MFWTLQRRWTRQELEWRKRAFDSYPRDLGLLLDVCAHGTKVVPCEDPVDVPTEPSPPKEPATTKPATPKAAEAGLRRAVKAANRYEAHIDTIAREELDEALVKIARKWKLDAARAAEIIDATRDW